MVGKRVLRPLLLYLYTQSVEINPKTHRVNSLQALVKNGDVFSGRPHVHMYYSFTKGKGIGIAEGALWKQQRKFGAKTLKK